MDERPWRAILIPDWRGRYPVVDFIRAQGDAGVRAAIIRKMRHIQEIEFEDFGRDLVDTVRGEVKRLKVDEQVRILFACLHREGRQGFLLMLEADRKKNGHIDEGAIQRAVQNLARWKRDGARGAISIGRAEELLGITTAKK